YTIWLDVFRRIITVADDPTLVNPLTGEATAEREKWIATLQLRDTTDDPLPSGAVGRTVMPLYTFNRDTGALQPVVAHVVTPDAYLPYALMYMLLIARGCGSYYRRPGQLAELEGEFTPLAENVVQ
ncbi:MAG: hypothetical protein WCJ56_14035, partial [bacterium]